jgi:hypothetical protein
MRSPAVSRIIVAVLFAMGFITPSAIATEASAAEQVTVIIPALKDNTLYEELGANGEYLSNGSGSFFFVGRTQDRTTAPISPPELRRAVIAFDIAEYVPTGSKIESVRLTLFMSRTRVGATEVKIHKLLKDWGEGASNAETRPNEGAGAPADLGDATWVHTFYDADFWVKPGGHFVPSASATTSVVGQNASYSWESQRMVNDVQSWLNASVQNFGWILIADEVNRSAKRFNSRENGINPPTLTVTYTRHRP